ncbi:MAG: diguanylate cyclase [Jannaschia sp.]
MKEITVRTEVFDRGLPMHVIFDGEGRIVRTGPTFQIVSPGAVGRKVTEVLRVLRPRIAGDATSLLDNLGRRITLELPLEARVPRGEPLTRMRAVIIRVGRGFGLANLYFGTEIARAVSRHELSSRHFAPVDPTVEMLFLMEAQKAVLGEHRNLSDRLVEARGRAEEQAITDTLTGLRNRRAMDRHLGSLTQSGAKPFALMHLDLDHFKAVNDTYGHAAGDHVLSRVGTILREEVRGDDMVARVGGDEFILVFADCTDTDLMRSIADRIIDRLEEPIAWKGGECRISGSIGITMSHFYDRPQPDELMSDADQALYASKNAGRSRSSVARTRLGDVPRRA